jgi:hypothetical protein
MKLISSKKIIADVFRDIDAKGSDWIYNAIEWINFALGELGGSYHTVLTSSDITVTNHRAKIPCDLEHIVKVIYNGEVLDKYNTINIEEFDVTNKPFWNKMTSPNYISTSFEEGTITLHYYTLATELDEATGIQMPLVPVDGNMQVRIYLQEYILMKYLAKGMPHPVRNYGEVKQGIYNPYGLLAKAQNAIKFPSPSDLDNVASVFNKWYSDYERPSTENFNAEGAMNTTSGDIKTYAIGQLDADGDYYTE